MDKGKSSPAHTPPNPAYGTLYVVATPIGNLADMTHRAITTLQSVAVIACEDTRGSRILCQHYSITTPLVAYHEHNSEQAVPKLVQRLKAGEDVALISDAGTPLISDPGYRLVTHLVAEGIAVVPIPGASSVMCGLSAAGLPTDRIYFAGFLPAKAKARQDALGALATIDATLVLFESNHRLKESLKDAASMLGGTRNAVVAREMTKRFETFRRGSLAELAEYYADETQIKGEIVLMVAPPETQTVSLDATVPLLQALLPHYPVKQACQMLAELNGLSRSALYDVALKVKEGL